MGVMRLRGILLGLVGVVVLGLSSGAMAAEDGGCPNEALRQELGSGFLPDCRAYEMVTPVYKQGFLFFPYSFSSDGDRAFLVSFGAVAGIEGESEVELEPAAYMDTRTVSGWRLEPVMAPLSKFIGQTPVAFDADSGLSLWKQHTPAQSATTFDLYVRSAGGEYSLVGPLATPEQEMGEPSDADEYGGGEAGYLQSVAATSDYSHIVMRSKELQGKWPFEGGAVSGNWVYEYSGTGNREPSLVNVTGPRGSTQVIGGCEAVFGSGGGGSGYNALSSDGETVFFSPLCGTVEVWARRHGSLRSVLPAESMDVSARAPEPACTGVCRSSVESNKSFEGASESGERVFFTSTQQLLNGASQDPNGSDSAFRPGEGATCATTTGMGGCNLYEYDFGAAEGNLRLVAGGAEVLGVARIAEDGSRVYFVAKGVLTGKGNEFGATPVAGEANLYMYDTEEAERDPSYKPVFVATLSRPSDQADWQRRDERPVQATADGRFLVFLSSRPGLTPGDTARTRQLFEYDAVTGELVRVSQGEDGYNDNGNEAVVGVNPGSLAKEFFEGRAREFRSSTNESNIADDGLTVVFNDVGRLSPRASSAAQGCSSVYEYRSVGPISDGGVHLVSDGLDQQLGRNGEKCGGGLFEKMDAEGENILFGTADPLLASDTDGVQPDVYDARVGGGFAPAAVAPVCQGEGCLGAPAAPPGLAGAGSRAAAGVGNVSPVVSSVGVGLKVRSLTRRQKLARALRVCRGKSRRRRAVCEAGVRRRYAAAFKVSTANGKAKR
jgi:hypothetical protein